MSILSDNYNCLPVKGNLDIELHATCMKSSTRKRAVYTDDIRSPYTQWLFMTRELLEKRDLMDMAKIESWLEWAQEFMRKRPGLYFKIEPFGIFRGWDKSAFSFKYRAVIWKYNPRKKTEHIILYAITIQPQNEMANDVMVKLIGCKDKIETKLWQ